MSILSDDLAIIYADIGLDAVRQDSSIVKIIFDSGLSEVGESDMRTARAVAPSNIVRNEILTISGNVYKVMRNPEPYGDMDEEVLITLLRQ